MGETIGIVIGVLGLLLAWRTFKIDKIDDIVEVRKITIEKLELLNKINSELLSDLYDYGNKTDSFDKTFMQGLTLTQCINTLQDVKEKLSDTENAEALRQSTSKMRLLEIKEGLETQIKHHSEIRTFFDFYVKPSLIKD